MYELDAIRGELVVMYFKLLLLVKDPAEKRQIVRPMLWPRVPCIGEQFRPTEVLDSMDVANVDDRCNGTLYVEFEGVDGNILQEMVNSSEGWIELEDAIPDKLDWLVPSMDKMPIYLT